MADDPFAMPRGNAPVLDGQARFQTWWHKYLGGIERLSRRQAADVAASAGATSVGELEAKVNEIVAALKSADLMKDS